MAVAIRPCAGVSELRSGLEGLRGGGVRARLWLDLTFFSEGPFQRNDKSLFSSGRKEKHVADGGTCRAHVGGDSGGAGKCVFASRHARRVRFASGCVPWSAGGNHGVCGVVLGRINTRSHFVGRARRTARRGRRHQNQRGVLGPRVLGIFAGS